MATATASTMHRSSIFASFHFWFVKATSHICYLDSLEAAVTAVATLQVAVLNNLIAVLVQLEAYTMLACAAIMRFFFKPIQKVYNFLLIHCSPPFFGDCGNGIQWVTVSSQPNQQLLM